MAIGWTDDLVERLSTLIRMTLGGDYALLRRNHVRLFAEKMEAIYLTSRVDQS